MPVRKLCLLMHLRAFVHSCSHAWRLTASWIVIYAYRWAQFWGNTTYWSCQYRLIRNESFHKFAWEQTFAALFARIKHCNPLLRLIELCPSGYDDSVGVDFQVFTTSRKHLVARFLSYAPPNFVLPQLDNASGGIGGKQVKVTQSIWKRRNYEMKTWAAQKFSLFFSELQVRQYNPDIYENRNMASTHLTGSHVNQVACWVALLHAVFSESMYQEGTRIS